MTFTKITLSDTGKRRVSSASAEETTTATSVTLNVTSVSYSIGKGIKTQPTLSKSENDDSTLVMGISETQLQGVTDSEININGVLDGTSTTDLIAFGDLVRHCKTRGVKKLTGVTPASCPLNYLNYRDTYFQDVSKTAATVNAGVYVRIKAFRFTQGAGRKYTSYTLTCVETS